ncbi:MAG TPA: BNR-4 repeat-containing protein [Kofleriaceae bacterium]|nr:BNR-4 repeat-containing protein [Kofleriaceae bacterium]
MRAGVLLVIAMGCSRGTPVPCNGVLEPGELCDDGNSSDGDGCDCATRLIPPVSYTPVAGDPVVIVEDGGWCWFQDERVVDVDGKVVVSSISHGGDIQVTSWDPASGQREHSILFTRLERDDHDVASLLPLPDGRLAAYFTRHDGFPSLWTRIAQTPGALGSWTPLKVTQFDYDVTYTNPFLVGDRTLLFMRGIDTNPTLVGSTDFGLSWSEGAQLLDSSERELDGRVFDHRPYVKYVSDSAGTVHLFYTDGHPVEFNRNSVYHLVYRDGALYRSDGARVAGAGLDDQPVLSPSSGTRVYDGNQLPGGQAWTWDAAIGADGKPVTVFSTFPDPERPYYDHRYRYARWDGSAWQVHTIAYGGTGIYVVEGFYSGGITLDPDDPNIVYFSSNVVPQTGEPTTSGKFEIYRGVTSDNGATWRITPVTSGSHVHNLRPIVPAHHTSPTEIVWLRGSYDTYLDYRVQVVGLVGAGDAMANAPVESDADLVALARFDLAATDQGPATPTAPGFVAAVPEGGYALATDRGISLMVSNITATRQAPDAVDPLYRGLALNSRHGFDPGNKLRVELTGLTPGADYVLRVHGHDTKDAYLRTTLWFRGDAKSLDSDNNAAYVLAHRNVSNTTAGEGYSDLFMHADDQGKLSIVGRGLDYYGADHTAVLSGVEVLQPPVTDLVARFDVDALPGDDTAPNAASISWDELTEFSGEATMAGITVRVTTDRIEALRRREDTTDPMLSDFVFGRDQLTVDVSGLEPGRLYAFTVYSTDTKYNLYDASRWRLDEPGREPRIVHGFHMNLQRTDEGAAFTFYHRATTSSFRLRGEDVVTSLSSNPSVVIFNGMDIRVAP